MLTNRLHTAQMLYNLKQKNPGRNLSVMYSGRTLVDTGTFTGPQAEDFFARFRVKNAFLSAQGVSLDGGLTATAPLYSHLERVMKASTEQVLMLLDSSRSSARSLVQVMRLDEVDIPVTDPSTPEDFVARLRQQGIQVHISDLEVISHQL